MGRGYANQSKASRARSRGLMQEESHAIVSRTRTRATQSRGPLQQESHAIVSRTRTTTYTRNPKPWSLATGVARFTKPHPYKHVHAQPKGRGPFNRSRTHHQAVEARKAIAFNFLKVEGRCGVVTTRIYLFKKISFFKLN